MSPVLIMLINFSHSNWDFPGLCYNERFCIETWTFLAFCHEILYLIKVFCSSRALWTLLWQGIVGAAATWKWKSKFHTWPPLTSAETSRSGLLPLGGGPPVTSTDTMEEEHIISGRIWKSWLPTLSSLTLQGRWWSKSVLWQQARLEV